MAEAAAGRALLLLHQLFAIEIVTRVLVRGWAPLIVTTVPAANRLLSIWAIEVVALVRFLVDSWAPLIVTTVTNFRR